MVPKPREQCSKSEQLTVSFAAGYIAGVFCAVVSHPAGKQIGLIVTLTALTTLLTLVVKQADLPRCRTSLQLQLACGATRSTVAYQGPVGVCGGTCSSGGADRRWCGPVGVVWYCIAQFGMWDTSSKLFLRRIATCLAPQGTQKLVLLCLNSQR